MKVIKDIALALVIYVAGLALALASVFMTRKYPDHRRVS